MYPTFKDKMTECNDSMYEWSIYGNRSTDFQILLMHSCSSIRERVLYNDLITVTVPFRISLSGVSYCFQNNFARFSRSTLFSGVGTIRSIFFFGICYVCKLEILLNGKRP